MTDTPFCPRMPHRDRAGVSALSPSAFSLVEVLVVVSVVALLVGIVLPVLRGVRRSAQNAACLSNLRQIGVAWSLYLDDYDNFPVTEGEYGPYYTHTVSWGGVHWFNEHNDNADLPSWLLLERPVNPYLGAKRDQEADWGVFQCPLDNSMRYSKSNERIDWEEEFGVFSYAEDPGESIYSMIGTSYAANDWLWCKPGATWGLGPGFMNYRTNLGPNHVETSASRVVLVCDYGMTYAGRYDLEGRLDDNIIYGWWHGYEVGHMMFLDASARAERMGDVTTQRYTFYLAPDKHKHGYRRVNRP